MADDVQPPVLEGVSSRLRLVIRTANLRSQKNRVYHLCHNHCPCQVIRISEIVLGGEVAKRVKGGRVVHDVAAATAAKVN